MIKNELRLFSVFVVSILTPTKSSLCYIGNKKILTVRQMNRRSAN